MERRLCLMALLCLITLTSIGDQEMKHDKHLSRKKRFLEFPEGTAITVECGLEIPLRVPESVALTVGFEVDFEIPKGDDAEDESKMTEKEASEKLKEEITRLNEDRLTIYRKIEKTLDRFGMDGHSCILRAICETTQKPLRKRGLFGEILNLIFSVPWSENSILTNDEEEYMDARWLGAQGKDCRSIFPHCHHSLFEIT